jgi:hypothetical protein
MKNSPCRPRAVGKLEYAYGEGWEYGVVSLTCMTHVALSQGGKNEQVQQR